MIDIKNSKPKKSKIIIFSAVCIVIAIIAAIIAVILINRPPAMQDFGNYRTEEYKGEIYYVIEDDYTGKYDIQTGYLDSVDMINESNYWDLIDQKIEEFNTQKILSFKEYTDFCKKWDLAQKFHDVNQNYITVAYASAGSSHADVRLADVTTNGQTAEIFIQEDVAGVVVSTSYYVLFIPVDNNITSFDTTTLITEKELRNVKEYGVPYDPNDTKTY